MKRFRTPALALAVIAVVALGFVLAEEKAPPKELTFDSKNGKVLFNHEKHLAAAKGDCKACHDTLFKQEKGDLGYKEGMHKKAEAAKTSCASCHVAGGAAFESKANCAKCHQKKAA
jgi:c(7)-type cytochrome triheme protein